MASNASDVSDPWYNIPEIVAGDIRDLKAAARLSQARIAALERQEASLRAENAMLREQLTGVARILATYPTARQFEALRAELASVRSEIWRPTTEFVSAISDRVLEALAREGDDTGGAGGEEPGDAAQPAQRRSALAAAMASQAAAGALARPRLSAPQLQAMVEEQVALEASRFNGKLAELQSQLDDKADKAGVAAALSQRLDEIYAFVEKLKDGVREVLLQKADVSEVNRVLEKKADSRLVSEALGRYALAATVEEQVAQLEGRMGELAEQEAFGRLARQAAAPRSSRSRQAGGGVEEGGHQSAELKNLQQAVSSLAEDTQARLSKLELSVVAASQAAEERARRAAEACLAQFRSALEAVDVNVRANSALIAKAQACAEQARSDASRTSAARAWAGDARAAGAAGAAVAPLSRDIAALSGRVLAMEASLQRKIDRAELQAVKRQLDAAPPMKTVSEALTARPTLDQVRSIIRDLVQGGLASASASAGATCAPGPVGSSGALEAPSASEIPNLSAAAQARGGYRCRGEGLEGSSDGDRV